MQFSTLLIAAAFAAAFAVASAVSGEARAGTDVAQPMDVDCMWTGAWVEPASRRRLAASDVLESAARRGIVLLGESHDNPDHHRWQAQTIAALHARGDGNITLGFEMFPRRVQPVLDAWVAGELDEQAFLDAVEWDRVWGFDPALYMPLFDFARINRVPMAALNVDRALIAKVREAGWDAVPEAEREGVSDPADPGPAYAEMLEAIYNEHRERQEQDPDPVGLKRFIEAQLIWDRAFAEALSQAAAAPGNPLVIGIIGSGHLEYRWGAPYQLAALGRPDAALLLPWDRGRDCADLSADFADAVFGFDPPLVVEREKPWRPRLGVAIETINGALHVLEVVEGSVAETAGIEAGDVITKAAGIGIIETGDLIDVIGRQAPGTWLPLVIERDGGKRVVIAKFLGAP